MNPTQVVDQAKNKFATALGHFEAELKKLRTGRAHPSMLDSVTVEAYGTPMPLNQVATVTTPEAQLIQISPFDPSNVAAIATAIRNNPSLGLNPTDDGRVIRVPVPPLNEERRRDLAKQVGQKQEECMVSLRGVRHDALDAIAKSKKEKELGEDDAKRLEKQVDDSMNDARGKAEAAARAKEAEIMTI
ncbi:MAG: frr, ribosome recycling factor [Candidatus Saccharibacteria bacterium]|nr:frr, ribosome recycling factor [Candidatus Saccharibacteria bacterium]